MTILNEEGPDLMKNTALITGASVGIGYELSKIFARNGYNLVLVSITKQKLEYLLVTEIRISHCVFFMFDFL